MGIIRPIRRPNCKAQQIKACDIEIEKAILQSFNPDENKKQFKTGVKQHKRINKNAPRNF